MRDDTCMYLFWKESDHQNMPQVLATSNTGKLDSNFQLTVLEDFIKEDPNQQWFYNRADGSFKNAAWANQKLDHSDNMGVNQDEQMNGWNIGFTATKGASNKINAGDSKSKYFFYNDALQSITTDYRGEHYQLSVPLKGNTQTGTTLEFLPIEEDSYAPNGKIAQFRI